MSAHAAQHLEAQILPYIPPRSSSNQQRRHTSAAPESLLDSAVGEDAGPKRSHSNAAGRRTTAAEALSSSNAARTTWDLQHPRYMQSLGQEKAGSQELGRHAQPASLYDSSGKGATRFPFKTKSAYFSSSHADFHTMAGALPAMTSPTTSPTAGLLAGSTINPKTNGVRAKNGSTRPVSPPGSLNSSSSGSSATVRDPRRETAVTEGNGPFEPPPTFGDKFIENKPTWTKEKEGILLGPFDYLYGHPGKDIRGQLISAFNVWLRVPESSLAVITKVIGMLHTASLLVDDVEDSSLLRRGNPVAHSIFGTAQTINSANYVYYLALQQLTTLPHAETAIQIFTDELLNLHRGQGMDLFWRDTLTCPTEDDYLEMVSNKTGGLFRLAIKLMVAESPLSQTRTPTTLFPTSNEAEIAAGPNPSDDGTATIPALDFIPLVNTIGLLFQILDDLLNLSSATYTSHKGLCEDLTEGKFSFPILHAIRADPSNRVLISILGKRTNDEEVKRYAVSYMRRMGSFDYTRKVLAVLEAKALRLIGAAELAVAGPEGRRGAEELRGILGRLRGL